MSSKYLTFNDAGLTALTNHMKVTRETADANVSAIEELGNDLAGLAVAVDEALAEITAMVGDVATVLDEINGDTMSDIHIMLDEINGEVV